MSAARVLESDALRVVVNPRVGGTITAIEHKKLGLSVLGTVPWTPVDAPLDPPAAPDESAWLTRYTGGWPLLLPNGGDACRLAGTFHGFHGEASISPWDADGDAHALHLTRRFSTVPVRMKRTIQIDGDLLAIHEAVELEGDRPIQVMWGHHPTFGSDLLAGAFEIETGARGVTADEGYDPPANPLRPGAGGSWPLVQGKSGPFDLRHPSGRMAALAYLHDFDSPWIGIRRLDNAVAVALSWDADVFPCAWLWYELGGTQDPPWLGRAQLIGLEPSTTRLAYGLAEAAKRGARLLTLKPGTPVSATVRLHVFKPAGAISGIDRDGRAARRA
jgi:galactose mutarotase-like enzyme